MSSYVNDFCPTVQVYYNELKKCKPISNAEEEELLKRAKNNDIEARNKILTSNLRFVFNIARTYRGCGIDMPDLIGEGNLGLSKAIDKFDETRGVRFLSYAVWWVKQAILESIKRNQKKCDNEVAPEEIIFNEYKKEPVDGLDLSDVESNFEIISEDSNKEAEQKETINTAMINLSKIEKKIICSYYGIDMPREMNLEEIGEEVNLSKERVRQIKWNALKKMRSEIMMMSGVEKLL